MRNEASGRVIQKEEEEARIMRSSQEMPKKQEEEEEIRTLEWKQYSVVDLENLGAPKGPKHNQTMTTDWRHANSIDPSGPLGPLRARCRRCWSLASDGVVVSVDSRPRLSQPGRKRRRRRRRPLAGRKPSCCPVAGQLYLPLLLLLFASATLQATATTTTTSLPPSAPSLPPTQPQTVYHRPELVSTLSSSQDQPAGISRRAVNRQGPSTFRELMTGADEQSDLDQVQTTVISVKGSLAFWRPPAATDHQATDPAASNRPAGHGPGQPKSRPTPSGQVVNSGRQPHNACNLAGSTSKQLNHQTNPTLSSTVSTPAHQPPLPEIVAVEGTSIKLNLVILGRRKPFQPTGSAAFAGQRQHDDDEQRDVMAEQQQQQSHPLNRLRLQWSRDGKPMLVNKPTGSRFSQQLISDSGGPRHLFALPGSSGNTSSNTSATHPTSIASFDQVPANHQQQQQATTLPSANEHFMLAPYAADQPHFQRQQLNEAKRLLGLAARRPPAQFSNSLPMIDDFLGDGQSIEWSKLEAYLKFSAQQQQLRLADLAPSVECHPQQPLERLALVQVELSRLSLADQGLYQLRVCPTASPQMAGNKAPATPGAGELCQPQAVFSLQVVEDVPHLEGLKPEHRPLEPGERLSIKCVATGFTLPQITWFLDGQQLNEHNQLADSQTSAGANPVASAAQGHLRIGDYVSQDDRVHSFVNSSQVQPTDGGFYKCLANNGLHSVELESRIDVRGPPVMARQLVNTSVLVGQGQLHLQCPYSGHPIGSVEWYFRPSAQHWSAQLGRVNFGAGSGQDSDYLPQPMALTSVQGSPLADIASSYSQMRARRRSDMSKSMSDSSSSSFDASFSDDMMSSIADTNSAGARNLDSDRDDDPDHDEWLSQASAMTPSSPEDYPEPMPDYPASGAASATLPGSATAADYDGLALAELRALPDYSDIGMDLQQTDRRRRRKRDASDPAAAAAAWIKLPQSRRHQVHLNGTLIIQDVSRTDQGFYKCRAVAQATSSAPANGNGHLQQQSSRGQSHSLDAAESGSSRLEDAHSNELYLTVLVPPVISPFASAETLREGMRNFLTCSVIEGDSPVRLAWFKDGQPIEDYIVQRGIQDEQQPQGQFASPWSNGHGQVGGSQARIRVDATNEYTSTLYFGHVDFKDNGNYTCIATNKAASVNYTARMLVNVPPKWVKAPKDIECVAGQNIVIDCQAQAHPSARIWWEIGVHSPSAMDAHQSSQSIKDSGSKTAASLATNSKKALLVSELHHHQQQELQQQHPANYNTHQLESQQPPNHYRTIISNSRIHILENASLVIRDVSKLDQGYYLCQAANNFGSLSSLIKLTVNVGASFSNKYQMKYVKLNDRIELDCDPIGQSPVDVTWYMRQTALASSTSPIIVRANQLNLSASSLLPQSVNQHLQPNQSSSAAAALESQHSFEPLNIRQQQLPQADSLGRRLFAGTIRTELQQNSGLIGMKPVAQVGSYLDHHQQQASGDGRSSLIGDLDHQLGQFELASQVVELDSSMSFELVRRSDGQSEFVRLIVKQARRAHSADYFCLASNRYGSDEKLIKLLVQEPPDPVQEIQASQVASRSASLTWQQPYNGNSPITSYTVEWTQAPATSGSKWSHLVAQQPAATISPLEPMTSYEFRVRAQNQFGQSPTAAPAGATIVQLGPRIIVTTTEEAPNAPPGDIQATPLSSSSIQLSWLPPGIQQPTMEPSKQLAGKQYPIKGYYLGYKMASMKNDSFIHKEVALSQTLGADRRHISPTGNLAHSALNSPDNATATATQALAMHQDHNATNGQPIGAHPNRLRVVIGDLKRNTKYVMIVQAFNSAGFGPQSDQIEASTLMNDPPPAPQLRVGTVSYKNIELQWSFQLDSGQQSKGQLIGTLTNSQIAPARYFSSLDQLQQQPSSQAQDTGNDDNTPADVTVDGYHLYYRSADSQWLDKRLRPETHQLQPVSALQRYEMAIVERPSGSQIESPATGSPQAGWLRETSLATLAQKSFSYKLDQLNCGNSYQIYLVAYNSIGSGLPSQIIRTKTRGSAPIAPRRQDFLTINSTYAQMNLDTWMDAGCSINNFEVRYRQLGARGGGQETEAGSQQWLLLSNNINPEQRSLELRDLLPETWYAIETIAESSAGKTEHQYSFMTLDKFGQVPLEALESNNNNHALNNLPALFRSNGGSIRSILHNFSLNGGGLMAPMVMSGCMFLILFATCSLFLIRRFNNQMKDNSSVDSQTTSAALSTSHYHAGPMSDSNLDCNGHRLLGNKNHYQQQQQHHYSGSINDEHYSLKSSPCKTTTTLGAASGSSANGSSGIMCANENPYRHNTAADQSLDLSQFMGAQSGPIGLGGGNGDIQAHCYHPQFHQSPCHPLQNGQQQAGAENEFSCPIDCDSPVANQAKFASLTREALGVICEQQQQSSLSNRFKTMPHRPVSTFIPSNSYQQQASSCNAPRYLFNTAGDENQQQQLQNDCNHQIYSKLRLIHNSNSSYNLCPEVELAQKVAEVSRVAMNEQSMNPVYTGDAINLAVLAQQNAKLLSCTLKRNSQGGSYQNAPINCNQDLSAAGDQLTSLLLDSQQEQQRTVDQNNGGYGSYLSGQQQAANNDDLTNAFTYGAPSVASGSGSSTNSTQPTTSSSLSVGHNSDDQLLNLTSNGVTNAKCHIDPHQCATSKKHCNHLKTSSVTNNCNSGQAQQQQQQQNLTNCSSQMSNVPLTGNEPSDYALPFPPKWV